MQTQPLRRIRALQVFRKGKSPPQMQETAVDIWIPARSGLLKTQKQPALMWRKI